MATKIVKKELMNDEIKEFGEDAASTINELLGLYGLEDESKRNELTVKFHRNNYKRIANISQKLMESKRRCSKASDSESTRVLKLNDYSSISSDKDSSSRENSKSPIALKRSTGSSSGGGGGGGGGVGGGCSDKQENNCSWCHQSINSESNETIGSGTGTFFCSENCFIFWRRASFKRAKTCDFCKNVRNAVSYVDFNDGTTQLQFCSDKCLNQYKMQIFCHETQAHLELNPHLKEKSKSDTNESLITPDLWLKNCRTRSPTPEQPFSESPSPMALAMAEEKMGLPKIIVTQQALPSSSAKITSAGANLTHGDNNNAVDVGGNNERKKQPMINVLPSSKLLSRNMLLHKNLRKRRVSARLAMSSKGNQNASANSSGGERSMNTNFSPSAAASDLRAKMFAANNSININNNNNNNISSNTNKPMQQHQQNSVSFPPRPPPPLPQFMQRPPINLFKFRLPFPAPFQQHRMPMGPQHQPPPPPPPPEDPNLNPLPCAPSLVPPPLSVVLVPYPIALPVILPIPLPLTAFMRAYQTKESRELSPNAGNDNESRAEMPREKSMRSRVEEASEEPLDLSSIEQGPCEPASKNSPLHDAAVASAAHDDDDDDNDDDDATNNNNSSSNNIEEEEDNDEIDEKMAKHEMLAAHMGNNARRNQSNEYTCESNRPLRKRKIISTEVDESF